MSPVLAYSVLPVDASSTSFTCAAWRPVDYTLLANVYEHDSIGSLTTMRIEAMQLRCHLRDPLYFTRRMFVL